MLSALMQCSATEMRLRTWLRGVALISNGTRTVRQTEKHTHIRAHTHMHMDTPTLSSHHSFDQPSGTSEVKTSKLCNTLLQGSATFWR